MTIDLRVTRYLPREFFENNLDCLALNVANEADIDGNNQLNVVRLGEGTQQISINEVEYNLFRFNLYRQASSENNDERRNQILALLQNPRECLQNFVRLKNAGQLNALEREAQAWLPRTDSAVEQFLATQVFSLRTYHQTPQTFRDHIAPNYFRNLASVATYNRDDNEEVSLEEVAGAIRQETQAQLRQSEQIIQNNFNEADSNHDHKITLEELKATEHIDANDRNANERIEAAFNRLDSDHNHELDINEFRASSPIENPSEQDYRTLAQILLLKANSELRQAQERLARDPENFRDIDRLSSRLSTFDLEYLQNLDSTTKNNNNTFRLLSWMQSQNGGQNILTHQRADALLSSSALDLHLLISNLSGLCELLQNNNSENGNPNPADVEFIQNFIRRFRAFPQHILTEDDLRLRVLSNSPLSVGELGRTLQRLFGQLESQLPAPILAQLSRNIQSSLGPLLMLAGEDGILNREEIDALLNRRRLSIVFRSIQNEVHNPEINNILTRKSAEIESGRLTGTVEEILTQVRPELRRQHISDSDINHLFDQIRTQMRRSSDLQEQERPHFLVPLWTQFEETKTQNQEAQVYNLTVSESHRKIDGNQFLARALIQYAYLQPSNILQTIQQTERRELLYLVERVADGIHDRARSHAGDGIPGVLHYMTYPLHWLGGYTWRERVAHHADEAHQKRLAAVNALRGVLANSSYSSLREAISHLENSEHQRILSEELHVKELERIYYIPNSREQEEAYIRFATHTLRGQVNPENGIIAAFRSRFAINNIHSAGDLALNHWQLRNGPAAATIYDRLINYSEHAQIHSRASASRFDLRGNGGDLNPMHWSQDFSDDEASLDGIWDSLGQQVMLFGIGSAIIKGLGYGFGLGGPASQLLTGVEFASRWRNHPHWAIRYLTYWPVRTLSWALTLPMHRNLSAAEVEIVNSNVLRYAQSTQWGRIPLLRALPGFIQSQRANLEVGRLLFHRNPQEAAARILRLTQIMLREAETCFASARTLTTEAQNLAQQSNITATQLQRIETAFSEASNLARQGHYLEQTAIQQRSSLGILARPLNPGTGLPEQSAAYQGLRTNLAGAERMIDQLQKAQRGQNISGVENFPRTLANIQRHLRHLQSTQSEMEGLNNYQSHLLRRGALAAGGLYGLAQLSENTAASQVAARMINPAAVIAQNPLMQGGSWQLYFLTWQMANQATLSDEYRTNPSLQEWALEMGIAGTDISPDQLMGAYQAHQRYRGSRAIYRDAFLSPVRESNEAERIRSENLRFPTTTSSQ